MKVPVILCSILRHLQVTEIVFKDISGELYVSNYLLYYFQLISTGSHSISLPLKTFSTNQIKEFVQSYIIIIEKLHHQCFVLFYYYACLYTYRSLYYIKDKFSSIFWFSQPIYILVILISTVLGLVILCLIIPSRGKQGLGNQCCSNGNDCHIKVHIHQPTNESEIVHDSGSKSSWSNK